MSKIVERDPLKEFGRLLNIMDNLRDKCPWDKQQTMQSLRKLTLEETYELAYAILKKDMDEIRGELGDLLLHIVFYAKIGSETGSFDIYDIIKTICEKLIHRHPHIYGDVEVQSADDVKRNWEELKLKEGRKGVLSGVPPSLPALIKANRIQEKAHGVGFDWKEREQVWDKIDEELLELKSELNSFNKTLSNENIEFIENEFGDLIFSIINAARLYGVDPENALEKTNLKFIDRFNYIEKQAKVRQLSLKEMTLEEMEAFWEQAKRMNRESF
jgi:XTP/dITP diphosphohydrolase